MSSRLSLQFLYTLDVSVGATQGCTVHRRCQRCLGAGVPRFSEACYGLRNSDSC